VGTAVAKSRARSSSGNNNKANPRLRGRECVRETTAALRVCGCLQQDNKIQNIQQQQRAVSKVPNEFAK